MEPEFKDFPQIELKDLSAREIRDIGEKAAKKERLTDLSRARVSPSSSQATVVHMMSRLQNKGNIVEFVDLFSGGSYVLLP